MSGAAVVHTGSVEVVLSPTPVEVPRAVQRRVDAIWEAEQRARPSLVDGTILSVEEIAGVRVTVRPCPYRLFLARERDPEVRAGADVRALGTSGLILAGSDDAVAVLVGRRAADVTEYRGAWELVPSGGIDPSLADDHGIVDVLAALLDELEEETGIPRASVHHIEPLGLVHDLMQDGYDVCFALRVRDAAVSAMSEYDETTLLPAAEALALLASGTAVVPTSRVVLELAREAGLL